MGLMPSDSLYLFYFFIFFFLEALESVLTAGLLQDLSALQIKKKNSTVATLAQYTVHEKQLDSTNKVTIIKNNKLYFQ